MAFDLRLRVSFLRLNLPEVVRYFPFACNLMTIGFMMNTKNLNMAIQIHTR
jgi:hypothetical protein